MRARTKILGIATGVLVLTLGGAATAYGAYYQDRALPGSVVGGIQVAGMTRQQVAAAVRERASTVRVQVNTPQGTRAVGLADLGTPVDVDATVREAFAANQDWRSYAKALVESRSIEAVAGADQRALDSLVRQLSGATDHPATDAKVTLGKDKQSFVVTPGVAGRALDTSRLSGVAAAAAQRLTSGSATLTTFEQAPAVTTEEATTIAGRANAMIKTAATLTDGEHTFTASAAQKASWLSIPAKAGNLGDPVLDKAKVAAWVTTSADSLRVAPRQGVRLLNSSGAPIRVVTSAVDGSEVTNAKAAAAATVAALEAGKAAPARLSTKVLPATWTERRLAPGAENLAYPAIAGEKWIDVNLSRHTMTAYVGGKVALGPISMVDGAPATPTDIGTFHIYLKNPMMTMRGQNADGTDYETPDVPWSSFFNGGEALHGAYWRETWGYAASHGCVNLPIPTAKWIYDWAPIGTPVVSHR